MSRARVLALVLLVGVVLDGRTRASVVDWLGGGAGELPAYRNEGSGRERPRSLELNGIRFAVAVGQTSDAPAAVRRFYGEKLRDGRHGYQLLDGQLRAAGAAPAADARELNQLAFGDDERGGIGGLDFGAAPSAAELGTRLGTLARTGDLGALGQLQMVLYQRSADGGTSYVDLWTPAGLSIDKLVPREGDVAGGDLDGVPRPSGARRVLAVGESGRRERLRAYRVAGASLVAVRDFYVGELRARGWSADERFARFAGARGRNQLRFAKGPRDLYLDFTSSDEDVDVVAIELGR
jgi:hypothetical protein